MRARGIGGVLMPLTMLLMLSLVVAAAPGTGGEPLKGAKPANPPAPPAPVAEVPELVPQLGHADGDVDAVAYSPEGQWVLTGGFRAACLWDIQTGKEIRRFVGHAERQAGKDIPRFLGHTESVNAVAFSPDGKRVLTGGSDFKACLWETHTGKLVRVFEMDKDEDEFDAKKSWRWSVERVAFSADGKLVLTGSKSRGIAVWDAATGKPLRRVWRDSKGRTWSGAIFVPGGKEVLLGVGNEAHFHSTTDDRELRQFAFPGGLLNRLAFSPDGKRMVTENAVSITSSELVVWDSETGKKLTQCKVAVQSILQLACSPDGRRILTAEWAGEDKLQLWDAETGKQLHLLRGHAAQVRTLVFSPDGKTALSGSRDGTARLWDVESGRQLRLFAGYTGYTSAVALSPDGKRILSSDGSTMKGVDLTTGQELPPFQEKDEAIVAMAYSPDGQRVVTGNFSHPEGAVCLWDAQTGKRLRTFQGDPSFPAREVFKMKQGEDLHDFLAEMPTYGGHMLRPGRTRPEFYAVAFSPSGKQILAGAGGDAAYLWDAETGELLRKFVVKRTNEDRAKSTHRSDKYDRVMAVAFSPDGKSVVLGGDKGSQLWDIETSRIQQTFDKDQICVVSVDVSPDGKFVLTRREREDDHPRLWDVKTGTPKWTARVGGNGVFSPDGAHVATSEAVLDAKDGKAVRDFRNGAGAKTICWSPDGKRVFTGGGANASYLRDAASGEELCRIVPSPAGVAIFAPGGYYLASRSSLRSVAFRVGDRAYPFDQFDLKLNRPDLVLQKIGLSPKELTDAYARACEKRVKKLGFSEERLSSEAHVPAVALGTLPPLVTADRTLKLKVKATDSKYLLDRLIVSVNGSPLQGAAGFSLRDRKSNTWEGVVDVELSSGQNSVRVSVLNEHGVESLQEGFHVTCTAPAPAPRVYAVVVGVSDYADKKFRLDYAAKDAKDLTDLLEKDAAGFGPAEVVRLTDKDATRGKVLQSRKVLERAGVDDLVIVFFAGHGMLDRNLDYYYATVDIDFAKPAGRGLSYPDIEGLLDGVKARRKLLLMDTCHSGEVDKGQATGGVAEAKVDDGNVKSRTFDVHDIPGDTDQSSRVLAEYFANLRVSSGAVVIAASGGLYHAFESREWKNGVFTYAMLRGLKSGAVARDKDGVVRVSKLRDHVLGEVRRLTNGQQVPTVRAEKLDTELGFDFPLNQSKSKK